MDAMESSTIQEVELLEIRFQVEILESFPVRCEILEQVLNIVEVIIFETPPQTSNRDLHH